TLHLERAQPRPVQRGIPFLGFVVFPDHRRLKRSRGIAYRRHLYALYARYRRGELDRQPLDASVRAWVGHAMHGDTWRLREKLFQPLALG
ncbi:MAG: hypothetical protein KIT87_29850, partial [Anaerolineae bacterium]|nr:hypothetical protein [Anaerolineae bacterium]